MYAVSIKDFAFVFVSIFVFTYFEAKYHCEWESCVFRYHLCRGPGRGTYSLCKALYTALACFVFFSFAQMCKELYTSLACLVFLCFTQMWKALRDICFGKTLHLLETVFCICTTYLISLTRMCKILHIALECNEMPSKA